MTLQGYLDSGKYMEVPELVGSEQRSCPNGPEDCVAFEESFGRRIYYKDVPELEALFMWLDLYCQVLHKNGHYKKIEGAGDVYEFSAKYFFGFAGIDYSGATLRVEELRMLDSETVYTWVVPVMNLHLVVDGEMRDLPIYPGYNYWREAMAFDADFEIPFGDVVLRVVSRTHACGDAYFNKYFSPVYVGYMRGGVNMLTDGEYLKWDSGELAMRKKASRFFWHLGEYEEKYESWSSDELRELTMEAMGYDMDEYRDNNWTDYLWE